MKVTPHAQTNDGGTSVASHPRPSSDSESRPVASASRIVRVPVERRLTERGEAARKALDEASPDAAPDERILNELVAKQLPVALLLHELEEQLATRIAMVMDDPRLAVAVARVLRETVAMSSAMSKRMQSTLSTAAALRAQRRFLQLNARASGAKSDV